MPNHHFESLSLSFWKLALFLVLFIVMSEVFGRVSDASALFSDFKESFRLSEYYVVDADTNNTIPVGLEPELQLENFPKNVIITQVRNMDLMVKHFERLMIKSAVNQNDNIDFCKLLQH